MKNLNATKCFFHGTREAEARCPTCGHFYCRECVTFFDGKLVCSSCIAKSNPETKPVQKSSFRKIVSFLPLSFYFFLLWVVFYLVGYRLMQVWADTHNQNVWEEADE